MGEIDRVSVVWLAASDELLEERVRGVERFYAYASDQEMMIAKYLPRNIEYNRLMMEAIKRLGLQYLEVVSLHSPEHTANDCFAMLER
ncbi:MAG: hypothetical protein QGF24_01480 [Dehalococcoidia bacterium]|nr:hypothetical protein [Dehalococcoidia bacterium]|tara:strand:- start:4575 stop:4838 length:264 start_codon:yes stop_codon:yes gene_type:complete